MTTTAGTPATAGASGAVLRAAIAYLVTGFVIFLLMGLLGLLMRLVHAGFVDLSPDWFYRIMTLHGAGMIGAVLLASTGGLAAVVGKVGGGRVALRARPLWVAYVLEMLGTGLAVVATVIGRFAAGWTVLYPLPEHGGTWSLWAAVVMFAAYAFTAVGFLVYCLHVLLAVGRALGGVTRGLAWKYLLTGASDGSGRLPTPPELIASVTCTAGIVCVLAGVAYLVPVFLQAAGLVETVNALFAKNAVYLYGHTIANLCIYFAAGLVYAILPLFTKKAWKTDRVVVLAWNLIIIVVLLPYFHHLYQDFAQPTALQYAGQIVSWIIPFPSFLVTIMSGLTLMYGSGITWSVPSILIALGLWGWVFGGMGALLDATVAVNQVMHNTLWVPAHFHTYFLLGAAAFAWAYLYHLVSDLGAGRETGWSRAAAWLYGIGGAGFVLMFFASGAASVPRRYAVHLPAWQIYDRVAVGFVLVLTVGLAYLTAEIAARLRPAWQRTRAFPG